MNDQWTVTAEWAAPLTDDQADTVTDQLARYGGALSLDPTAGTVSATFTIEATTLRQAIDAALTTSRHASHAVDAPMLLIGLDVLRMDVAEDRAMNPSIPELVGYAEIAGMAGISRQRAAQLAAEHADFPPAVVQVKAGPLRVRSQVEAWLARPRRTGRPKGSAVRPKVSA